MKQTVIIVCLALLGSIDAFAAEPARPDSAPSTEARLRQQVEELTNLLKQSREVAQNLNSRMAVMDAEQDLHSVAIAILRDVNPQTAHVLLEVAQIQTRVDSLEDVVKVREMNDGSPEAMENLRRTRHRHLSAIDAWVKGQEYLKKVLASKPNKTH